SLAASRRDRRDHRGDRKGDGAAGQRQRQNRRLRSVRGAGDPVMASDADGLGSEGAAARPKFYRSIAALLADLAAQVRSLARQEVALFKAELLEKLGLIGQGVGAIAGGWHSSPPRCSALRSLLHRGS